ncbi:MAG: hypothetical protein IAE90_01805 [Ignavibacteria bacterium]|nr:hypothetical protein [Ignavibacteria bacterium]
MGSISLISPEDGAEIDPKQPIVFTWTPLPKGGPYSIKIVEIKGDQSPDVAIKENRPILDKEGVKVNTYQYGLTDPKLVAGKKYAWQVTSGEVESEAWTFRMMSSQYQIIVDTVIIKCDTLTFNPNKFFYQIKIRNNNSAGTSGPSNTAKAYITSTNPIVTSIIPDFNTPITISYNNTGIISGSINFLIAPSSIQFVAKLEDNTQPEVYNATAPYTISLPICNISEGKCDCGRIDFQNNKITYTSSGELRTVSIQCDATYRVDPGSMVLFSPAFNCGGNCQARYEYTVNGIPKGIQASPYAIGPVNFLTNVKIRYWCGDNICDSCIVILDTLSKKELGDCGCNIGGLVFVNYNNSSETYPCPCGATINVNSNTLITFTPKNPCSGDSLCFKGSSYQILDSNYIVVGQSQLNIPPQGSFSYNFYLGNYTVKIKSICGSDTCECIIYIATGKPDCDCGRWENNNSGIGYTTKPPIPDINRVPKSNNKQENEDIRKLKIIPDTGIVNSNQNANSVNCNDTLSNFEKNTEFRFTSATYLCSSPGCTPQYIWTIKHPAPSTLVQDVNVKSFTTTLSESGIYTITRKITCGGKICDECVFYVKVDDVNTGHNTGNCNCGGWQREKKVTFSDNQRSWTKNIECFMPNVLGPVKPGLPITFVASYLCVPNCPTKYNWILYNMTDNTIESFADNVTGMPIQFTPAGSLTNYRFVLYPNCGGKICDSCGFNFKTLEKKQTCDCGRWFSRSLTAIHDGKDTLYNDYINCKDTIKISKLNTAINLFGSYACGSSDTGHCRAKYQFDWKTPSNQYNTSGNLVIGEYSFPAATQGIYSVTLYSLCDSKKCDSCNIFIKLDTNYINDNSCKTKTLNISSGINGMWYVVSDPNISTIEPREVTTVDIYGYKGWNDPFPQTKWINANIEEKGIYTYQCCFCLENTDNASISLKYYVDNEARFFLNGYELPDYKVDFPGNFNKPFKQVSISNELLNNGNNCLIFIVKNYNAFGHGTPTGLNVQGVVLGNVLKQNCCNKAVLPANCSCGDNVIPKIIVTNRNSMSPKTEELSDDEGTSLNSFYSLSTGNELSFSCDYFCSNQYCPPQFKWEVLNDNDLVIFETTEQIFRYAFSFQGFPKPVYYKLRLTIKCLDNTCKTLTIRINQ